MVIAEELGCVGLGEDARSSHLPHLPLVQGKEQWLLFAGAAVNRYPTSKVRETQDGRCW